jgi:hypothetical protein
LGAMLAKNVPADTVARIERIIIEPVRPGDVSARGERTSDDELAADEKAQPPPSPLSQPLESEPVRNVRLGHRPMLFGFQSASGEGR